MTINMGAESNQYINVQPYNDRFVMLFESLLRIMQSQKSTDSKAINHTNTSTMNELPGIEKVTIYCLTSLFLHNI